jgi:large repetitive protein
VVKFRVCLFFLALLSVLSVPGCSSNGTIQITLSPTTPPVINAGQSQAITASLTNDVHSQGVTWSLTGPGSLIDQTSTSVTFIAPVGISIETTSTVTATSVASTTVTATLNITVNPVLGISTSSLPVGTVNVPYVGVIGAVGATGTFTWNLISGNLPPGLSLSSSSTSSVTILGTPNTVGTSKFTIQVVDSAGSSVSRTFSITINPPPPLAVTTTSLPQGTVGITYPSTQLQTNQSGSFSWTQTGGTLPPGLSLSTAGVISGTPTTVGTFTFTVQVTNASGQTANANLTIVINPSSAGDSELNGNYAFLVSGFTGTNNSVTAGSFTADGNGNITAGLLDSNSNGGGAAQVGQIFTGKYVIGSNGQGTVTLNVTGGGTSTFAAAVSPSGNGGNIIQYGTTTGSGVLLKQTGLTNFSVGSIDGNYAFGFLGANGTAPVQSRYGFAGIFAADGTGQFTSGTLDSDDSVNGTTSNVGFTGIYSVSNAANGRGTITLTVGTAVTNYSFYAVSPTQLLVMETDSIAGSNLLVSGSALQQSSSSFTDASLSGTSVLESTALNASSQTVGQVGLFATNGGGNSTLTGEEVTNSVGAPTSGSGTYTVSANGRVTLSGSGIASPDPVLYLVSTNEAFIVGTDSDVTFGFMESQSGVTLSTPYIGGSIAPTQSAATDQVDFATNTGGNLAYTTEITNGTGLGQQSPSGTCSLGSNGECTVTGVGYIFVVSPTEFYQLNTNSFATIEHFQQ